MGRMNLQVTSVVGHGKTGSEAAGMRVNQQKRILEEIKQYKYQVELNLSLQVLSADNLCKQFGPRSGPLKMGSKLFDILMVFLKELF